MTILEGIFLRVQGPEPHIDAIIFPSDPVRPGDSATLQCSVLSEYQNKICPEEPGVYWFKTRSDQSHPSFIYAHGSNGDECKRSKTQQSCVCSSSKNVSSSDAGTYYCAVVMCGEIFFGNRKKMDIKDSQKGNIVLLSAALAVCLIIITFLIYTIKKNLCDCCKASFTSQINCFKTAAAITDLRSQQRDEDSLVYSAPTFTKRKADRGARTDAKAEVEDSVYSGVRISGLN
ncbi:hypothetical protein LDENG_00271150 [Lucifuga dentata]|nr:hypothetical protein LDENG_00271150 [Lucifuga dentata]